MESVVHDQVNLVRLVRRLQSAADTQAWEKAGSFPWTAVANAQQSLKYARSLVTKLEGDADSQISPPNLTSIRLTLDRLEPIFQDSYQKLAPPPPKPRQSLLSALPVPKPREQPSQSLGQGLTPADPITVSPESNAAAQLLLTPSEEPTVLNFASQSSQNTPATPPSLPRPSPLSNPRPKSESEPSAHLATSLQTQEELSLQLAQMASQLKLNALHFTEALAKDKAVMEGAEEKLEGNLTRLKGERSRLKEHSGKSSGTTWMVLGAILVVCIAWVLMFLVIRIT